VTVAASETTVSTETDTYMFQMKEIALSMTAGSRTLAMINHAVSHYQNLQHVTAAALETMVSTEMDIFMFQMKETILSMIAGSKTLATTNHAVSQNLFVTTVATETTMFQMKETRKLTSTPSLLSTVK